MTKTITRLLATVTLFALPAAAQAAVTLNIENGKLTGATGVTIGDKSYDVSFVEGTCATVYGACAAASFDFRTAAAATDAANALLAQVFVDGTAGKFDTVSSLTVGCPNGVLCGVMIAYMTTGSNFSFKSARNWDNEISDGAASGVYLSSYNSAGQGNETFARFSLNESAGTAAVPEPATWALMLAGFGLTATALRRRRVRFAGAAA